MSAQITRRDFLNVAIRGVLGLGGLVGLGMAGRYLDFQSEAPLPTEFNLGPAEYYPPGSHTLLAEARALLLHTPDGFMAFSLVCPHLGCTIQPVEPTETGRLEYACPCHGSRFDSNGVLLRGPADQPLRALRVEQTAQGNLILHTD